MSKQSVAYFAKRARRRIVEDLPEELQDTDDTDILGVCRGRVSQRLLNAARREAGLPPHARRSTFDLPDLPASTRRSNSRRERPFHIGFAKPMHARSAAEDDAYASAKDERDLEKQRARDRDRAHEAERARRDALDVGLVLDPSNGEPAAAQARDTYAAKDPAKVAAVFTNLDPDLLKRGSQWDEIEAHERKLLNKSRSKGADRINIELAHSRELIEAVVAHNGCPAGLRERIYDALSGEKPGRSGVAWVSAEAARAHTWIRTLPEFAAASDSQRKALRHSSGRAVADHDFAEFELPSSLGAEAKARVAAQTADYLANLPGREDSHDPHFQVPVTVVIHNPDALNHSQNVHFHVVSAKRRYCLASDGSLVRDSGGAPIAEAHRVPAICAPNWKRTLRAQYADIVNAELAAANLEERLHPGPYAGMGIDAVAMTKLHNNQTVLNRAGVRTKSAYDNATEGWRRVFADIDAAYTRSCNTADQRRRDADDRIGDEVGDPAVAVRLREQAAHAAALQREAARCVRDADYIETYVAMARSSTDAPVAFADHYADAARKAGRSAYSAYDVSGWQQRAEAARAFRDRQHGELAEERAAVAGHRSAAEALERRAAILDAALVEAISRAVATQAASVAAVLNTTKDEIQFPSKPVAETTFAAEPVSATPPVLAEREIHAVIKAIAETPLLLSREAERYFVAPADDDDKTGAAHVDLNIGGTAARLAAIHSWQQSELDAVRAHVAKHGDRPSAAGYMARQQKRWSTQPVYARMVAQTVTRAAVTPPSDTHPIANEAARVTVPKPTTLPPALPVPMHPFEQRRRFAIEREVADAFETFLGSEKPTYAAAWSLHRNQREPYSSRSVSPFDGWTTDAEKFALFMRFQPFADRAEKLEKGEPTTQSEVANILGTDPSHEPWRDTGFVRVISDWVDYFPHRKDIDRANRSERFENCISADLGQLQIRPPPLTREPSGEVGVFDQEVLERTSRNHLGLRLQSSQGVLVGLYLEQEIRREELAVERPGLPGDGTARSTASSGVDDLALKVWRRAVAQNEEAAVLTWSGDRLVGSRAERDARLAKLSDEEKRKLREQVTWDKRQFVPAPPLPDGTRRRRRKTRKQSWDR